MCAKTISQIQKILYGIMLFVMVIATTGARGAPSTELWRKEESLDSSDEEWQVNQLMSLEQELDSYEQNRDINTSFAHNGDYFKARLIQLVKVESKDISISITDPLQGELVSDNLEICVQINSLYEVQQVKAVVETLETTLIYSGGCWGGSISILGLTRGTKVLKVTATDVYGSTEVAETTFIYDQPPVLNIQAPLDLTVARPQLQLTISCTDDDPVGCASINVYSSVYYGTETLIATGQNNINQSVSLANYDGQYIKLSIYARDSAGQSVYVTRRVYVESSVKLHEVERVSGLLWDVQPDRILYVDCVSGALKILNRLTRQDTILLNLSNQLDCPLNVPGDSFVFRRHGFLTPLGSIFSAAGSIYDYQDGVLLELDHVGGSAGSLEVKGNYAIWNEDYLGQSNSHLLLRNLITGTIITIATQNMDSSVASNGDVVYLLNNQIYRFRYGITTEIPSDVNPVRKSLLTDGINIVYDTCDSNYNFRTCDIILYGESGKITLATLPQHRESEAWGYQVNDGWVAYNKLGSGGQLQVWTHSPSGQDTQISFFGSSSQIDSLAPNGEVTFVNRDRLYLSKPGLVPVDISSSLGRSFWQNGQWYVHIGRSLFLYDAYTVSGNAGVAGATLSYVVETMQTTVADATGNYLLTVPTNWSGTITPIKQGYIFSPASRTYTNVLADQVGQNYIATVTAITYNISGNAEVSGATLSYTDGTPKTVISDSSGNYSLTVTYNWSGIVTPSKMGYTFNPASITYTNVLTDQTGQNYVTLPVGPTISGNTWEGGVTLSYVDSIPRTVISDSVGNYSLTVTNNWSGIVTPSKAGYTFNPASITYTNVLTDQTGQNYIALPITYTISGNAWESGVTLSYIDGTPKTAISDGSGNYSLTVSENWSGIVTPSKAGYTFNPASITYTNVLTDQTGQNYIALPITYTISGNAWESGVTLSYIDGTPKTAISDGSGNYSLTVTYNWSGTVTPSKTGYTFNPASITYTNVLTDQTGQNYVALPITYTISGNAGVEGATLSYTDGTPKTVISDSSGNYSLSVTYNWSGTVTPSKTGYAFLPDNRTYTNVVENQTVQNYTAVVVTFTDVSNSYWAWSWIERLYAAGVTSGCSTNPMMYCPEDPVTRAQMAIFLERGMNGSAFTPPAGTGTVFADVPLNYWAVNWIEKLYVDGITAGCLTSPLSYCPDNPVTRAQMAIFLLRARHGSTYTPPAVGSSTGFNDISTSHWAAAWIKQLAAEGITTGCGSGNYCPEDSVTRAQMAVFLVRTFNLP
jgi:hypothetical protein